MKINLKILIIIALLSANLSSNAAYKALDSAQVHELMHSQYRTVISLAGTWQKSYDNAAWNNSAAVPFTETNRKSVTYKKDIRLDDNTVKNKNLHFIFPGLEGQVEIYFNDDFLIKYDGGLVPIDIAIPSKSIKIGNNELKLIFLENSKLENQLNIAVFNSPQTVKGIIREPFLVATSKIWISEVKYFAKENANIEANIFCSAGQIDDVLSSKNDSSNSGVGTKKTQIRLEYQLFNKQTGKAEMLQPESKFLTVEDSRTINLKVNIPCASLKAWSIESPELYMLRVYIFQGGNLIDDYFINIGLKKITHTKGKGIVLNGNPVEIKAVAYSEYFQSVNNTLTAYRMEEDIKSIKILGANAIKFQYHPPHPYLAYLCDKYGLMMLIEMPLYNTPQEIVAHEEVVASSKNILSRIVNSYSNNVSFFALGLGNAVYECEKYSLLTKDLLASVKQLQFLKYKTVELGIETFDADGFDFICANLRKNMPYEQIKVELEEMKKKLEIPVVFSFSSIVQPDNHAGYSSTNSLEHQAYFIKSCYSISKSAKVAGCLINSFNDCKTNYPVLAIDYYDNYNETNGLTDGYRNTRLSFLLVKSLLNNEKLPLLNAGTYESETPVTYTVLGFVVLLALLLILNRYKRFREYFVRAILRPYNFYADIRDNRIMSISQTIILALIIAFSVSLCFASAMIALRSDLDYNYFFRALIPFSSLLDVLFIAAWQPEILLFLFTCIIAMKILLGALILRLAAILLRARIFIGNTITIVVWAFLPFVFLLPISILFSRLLMLSDAYMGIFSVIVLALLIWSVFRLLKACSVVFDTPKIKVYSIGLAALFVFVIVPVFFYESSYNISTFINYFYYLP